MKRRNLLKFLLLEAIALNYLFRDQVQASTWSYQGETGSECSTSASFKQQIFSRV